MVGRAIHSKMIKCEICNRKAVSLIRGIHTCGNCFYLLKKDNLRRFNEVVTDLKILRECMDCKERHLHEVSYRRTYEGLEVKPFYCKKCK